jgi:NAD(P)-dependent dehydrogenase (short-subunit alcohol dehydrogenase family)
MDEFNELMDVNVKGLFHLLRVQLKHIVDGGSIVNVNSVSAHYGAPYYAAYAGAKFAAKGISRSAAFEGAARGIRVNNLLP